MLSMSPVVLSGNGNLPLARAIATRLGVSLGRRTLELFPDGEQRVELHESVRGRDAYIIQSTAPPVAQHLMELLLLADACRRAGGSRLTGIVSYLGYARQDRRAHGREPVSARLVADLIETSGIERIVAVDLHSPALEGVFHVPVEHLSAVPILATALRPMISARSVAVAPDLGAAKLAERYGDLLDLPVVVIHKLRLSGSEVRVRRIAGDVAGRAPVIVDDMITTGATVEAAAQAVLREGCTPEVTAAASHALLVEGAHGRLQRAGVRRLIISDSVKLGERPPIPCDVLSVAPLLAEAIQRLHQNESLGNLVVHE